MAKNTGFFIALGGIAALGLVMSGRKEDVPSETPLKALLPDFVSNRLNTRRAMCQTLTDMVQAGESFSAISPDVLSLTYLGFKYPSIAWDTISLVGFDMQSVWRAGALVLAESILQDSRSCATSFPTANSGEVALGVFDSLTSPEPRAQHFYKIRPGDTPANIIQRVFEPAQIPLTNVNFELYGQCIASGPQWNFRLFSRPELLIGGVPDPQTAWTRHSAGGEMRNILLAFDEANENASAAVGDVRPPRPNLIWPSVGDDAFDTRGVLWLPPIFDTEGGGLSCGTNSWSDGTTTLDPPPNFMSQITQASHLSSAILNL